MKMQKSAFSYEKFENAEKWIKKNLKMNMSKIENIVKLEINAII